MKTLKDFEVNFTKVINENKVNTKLINYINQQFISKGLSSNVGLLLFEGHMGVEELGLNERISLSKSMYEYLGLKLLNPKLYFSDNELTSYDLMVSIPNEKKDTIVFEEVKKLNDKSYIGVLTSEMAESIRDNRLFAYFKEVQRPTINVKNRGQVIKKINVNRKGVIDLRNRLINHSILPTAITFSVLCLDNKEPNVIFNKIGKTIGNLIIKPNFNREDKDYTPFIINDGYHRLSSLIEAQEVAKKQGKELNESLYCIINIVTLDEAKQYFLDSFKHNTLKEEELKPLIPSIKNKFLDIIIDNNKYLKDKVGTTYRDMKTSNKITYKSLLLDTIERLDINLKSDIQCNLLGNSYSKLLQGLIEGIIEIRFNGEIKEFNNSIFNSINIYTGYLYLCSILINKNDKLMDIIMLVSTLEEEDFKDREIDLYNKKLDIEEMILFFKELLINNDI